MALFQSFILGPRRTVARSDSIQTSIEFHPCSRKPSWHKARYSIRNTDDYLRLAAELQLDLSLFETLAVKHAKAVERTRESSEDDLLWAATGYTIHNVYSLFENYSLRIPKLFENGLDSNSWHAELVDRDVHRDPGTQATPFQRIIRKANRYIEAGWPCLQEYVSVRT